MRSATADSSSSSSSGSSSGFSARSSKDQSSVLRAGLRSSAASDSAKARIRDAALERFARDGLDASLRAIASDAGVSAPLILHHFGSRSGLRAACDQYAVQLVRESKSAVLDPFTGPATFERLAADSSQYTVLLGYLLRLLQAGGDTTQQIVDRLAENACTYLTAGVAAGTIRPVADMPALARWLTEMSLGAILLELPSRHGPFAIDELGQWLAAYQRRILGPALELFTFGLFTDSTLLDVHRSSSPPTPRGATHD